jgi:DNA-binding PadR family transcriptional regulator
MMMIRLLILWLLSEGPLHGYHIRRILAEPSLAAWVRVEDGSIYSMLKTLAREGFVAAEAPTPTTGRGPQPKAQYRITSRGREHYAALLEQAWREPLLLAHPVQVALAAQADLPAERLSELWTQRHAVLGAQRATLEATRRSAPHPHMADRALALIDAELRWIESAFPVATPQGAPP